MCSEPTSTPSPARTSSHVADRRLARGILDTSVVIDLDRIEPAALPREVAVTSITMAGTGRRPACDGRRRRAGSTAGPATAGRGCVRTVAVRRCCCACIRPHLRIGHRAAPHGSWSTRRRLADRCGRLLSRTPIVHAQSRRFASTRGSRDRRRHLSESCAITRRIARARARSDECAVASEASLAAYRGPSPSPRAVAAAACRDLRLWRAGARGAMIHS